MTDEIDAVAERWEKAQGLARAVVFGPKGLRRYPWYRAVQRELFQRIGPSTMLTDVAVEAYLALQDGASDMDAMYVAHAAMGREWRREYSQEYRRPQLWDPTILPSVVDNRHHAPDPAEDTEDVARLDEVRHLLDRARELATDAEWRALMALMEYGSQRAAAAAYGRSHGWVGAAVLRVRKKMEAAGYTPSNFQESSDQGL